MADEESLLCRVKEKAIETSLARSLASHWVASRRRKCLIYIQINSPHSFTVLVCVCPPTTILLNSIYSLTGKREIAF